MCRCNILVTIPCGLFLVNLCVIKFLEYIQCVPLNAPGVPCGTAPPPPQPSLGVTQGYDTLITPRQSVSRNHCYTAGEKAKVCQIFAGFALSIDNSTFHPVV